MGLAVGSDGAIYTVNAEPPIVRVLRPGDMTFTRWGDPSLDGLLAMGHTGMGVAEDGTLFVANGTHIYHVSSELGILSTWPLAGFTGPAAGSGTADALAISPDGDVYVTSRIVGETDLKGNVYAYSESGQVVETFLQGAGGSAPSITVAPDGNVYVVKTPLDGGLPAQIVEIPVGSGSSTPIWSSPESGAQSPIAIAADSHGTIYFTSSNSNVVTVLRPTGDAARTSGRPAATARSIWRDAGATHSALCIVSRVEAESAFRVQACRAVDDDRC